MIAPFCLLVGEETISIQNKFIIIFLPHRYIGNIVLSISFYVNYASMCLILIFQTAVVRTPLDKEIAGYLIPF
jgi:hypothetical protein